MAETYLKKKNKIIQSRKRKIRVRRYILFVILFLSILVTLGLKLKYFNITSIKVNNNKNVTEEEIIHLSNIYKGNNIFYINIGKSKTKLKKNSYILDVEIKRQFPSEIIIEVKEREAEFYCTKGDKFYVIDRNGIILEEKDKLTNPKLIKLDGFDMNEATVGNTLPCDDKRKIEMIGTITDLVSNSTSKLVMSSADVSDLLNIQVYYGNMCVKLGTNSNLKDKLNKALNILHRNEFNEAKGYIDVRFNSMPVYYIEK